MLQLPSPSGPPFDVIVGTDVIFNQTLVEPLLRCMHRFSHAGTVVWLCLQERCADAHRELLDVAPRYFQVTDESEKLGATKGCESAGDLDVILLRLKPREAQSWTETRVQSSTLVHGAGKKKRRRQESVVSESSEQGAIAIGHDREMSSSLVDETVASGPVEAATSSVPSATLSSRQRKKKKGPGKQVKAAGA